ncbi:MAG: NF038122 family metalloprotease [Cyanobacteria bacterium J06621_11]
MVLTSQSIQRFSSVLPAAAVLALPIVASLQPSAQAVSFRFDLNRKASDEFKWAVEDAAKGWSSTLKDDTVVDIKIEFTDLSKLGGSILGGAQAGKVKVKYEDYVEALFRDAASDDDYAGVGSLQLSSKDREIFQDFQTGRIEAEKVKLESKEFSFLLDGDFAPDNRRWQRSSSFLDDSGGDNNKNILLTRAQAKALNLVDGKKRGLDAVIKINSQVDWDFNQNNGVEADRYDAVSVIQHEIGHALGVVSGVDSLDFLASTNAPVDKDQDKFSYLTPMDFYRYSVESANLGVMDLTLGGEKYFSLDGGQSAVRDEFGRAAYFSTGSLSSGGDGYQGSHWRETDGTTLGIMNPSLQRGESSRISQLDTRLLDVVGWDIEDTTAERAAAIGLDWTQLTNQLERDRQAAIDREINRWRGAIPALAAAIDDASTEFDLEFREKLRKEFQKLEKKVLEKPKNRSKELSKFYEKVEKEADKRNEKISKLPEEIYETDEKVLEWLEKSSSELAKKLQEAEPTEINRLANLVKAMPADDRGRFEAKLENALATFSDKPDKLVEELLDTSGPANPIAYGFRFRWWFYWQLGDGLEDDDFDDDDYSETYSDFIENQYRYLLAAEPDLTSNATLENLENQQGLSGFSELQPLSAATLDLSKLSDSAQQTGKAAQDIPEPSSVLALFGIAVLGAKYARNRRTQTDDAD